MHFGHNQSLQLALWNCQYNKYCLLGVLESPQRSMVVRELERLEFSYHGGQADSETQNCLYKARKKLRIQPESVQIHNTLNLPALAMATLRSMHNAVWRWKPNGRDHIKHCGENLDTCSQRGVLKTRCFPNRSRNPVVHRNTPPNPTSSPNTYDLRGGSRHGSINPSPLSTQQLWIKPVDQPAAKGKRQLDARLTWDRIPRLWEALDWRPRTSSACWWLLSSPHLHMAAPLSPDPSPWWNTASVPNSRVPESRSIA